MDASREHQEPPGPQKLHRSTMALPRLILVADRFTDPDIAKRVLRAVQYGIEWVHFRDHAATEDAFYFAAGALISRINQFGSKTIVSINSRLSTAKSMGLPLHTGVHGPAVGEALGVLGPGTMVGQSVHSTAEIEDARLGGARYVIYGSVYPTRTHPNENAQGTERLAEACEAAGSMPVIAMGGVTPDRVAECLDAGAHGVAVVSAIIQAEDIFAAVGAFTKQISTD